jgi:hypothetical protein
VAVPPRHVHRRWCVPPGILALTLLVLAVVPATAMPHAGAIVVPARGPVVRAGEWVRTRWEPLPADVDEFELLLVLDGARAPRVRLTGQLSPERESYLWRVPNLPCLSARLLLRFSRGHDEEEEAEPGEAFSIVGTVLEPVARLSYVRGEWWVATDGGTWPARPPCRESRLEADAPAGPPADRAVPGEGRTVPGESLAMPAGSSFGSSRAIVPAALAVPLTRCPRAMPQRE